MPQTHYLPTIDNVFCFLVGSDGGVYVSLLLPGQKSSLKVSSYLFTIMYFVYAINWTSLDNNLTVDISPLFIVRLQGYYEIVCYLILKWDVT